MFKKILVPRDGSETAERIGGWATDLARALGAEVHLVSVVDPHTIELPGATARPGTAL